MPAPDNKYSQHKQIMASVANPAIKLERNSGPTPKLIVVMVLDPTHRVAFSSFISTFGCHVDIAVSSIGNI